jgi:methyl coenzyme M reductase subunit C-like uncharacterized protein (methanogenesis marker protein 7)
VFESNSLAEPSLTHPACDALRHLTRACSRQAGLARGSARAAPSGGAAKEVWVCAGAGLRACS